MNPTTPPEVAAAALEASRIAAAHPGEVRPLLVGESNPLSSRPEHALWPWPPGCSGDHLRSILGLSLLDYFRLFDRTNLLEGRWLPRAAREAAVALDASVPAAVPLVLLGARVREAFDLSHQALLCSWEGLGPWSRWRRWVAVPHPSGRSRAWNRPGSRERARDLVLATLGPSRP